MVVAGFSTLAITGSRELSRQVFNVTDVVVEPQSATAGEEITIGGMVANTGTEAAVFPGILWVDHDIEGVQDIPVAAGESVGFSFSLTKPAGVYSLRIERVVDEFLVRSAPGAYLAFRPRLRR